jgi:hypothetical protein
MDTNRKRIGERRHRRIGWHGGTGFDRISEPFQSNARRLPDPKQTEPPCRENPRRREAP